MLLKPEPLATQVAPTIRPETEDDQRTATPWQVIVWDDPVNLMSYVVWVFRTLFGYPETEATRLMLLVHNTGKAVVANGNRERCELDVMRLHHHGLWATMEQE